MKPLGQSLSSAHQFAGWTWEAPEYPEINTQPNQTQTLILFHHLRSNFGGDVVWRRYNSGSWMQCPAVFATWSQCHTHDCDCDIHGGQPKQFTVINGLQKQKRSWRHFAHVKGRGKNLQHGCSKFKTGSRRLLIGYQHHPTWVPLWMQKLNHVQKKWPFAKILVGKPPFYVVQLYVPIFRYYAWTCKVEPDKANGQFPGKWNERRFQKQLSHCRRVTLLPGSLRQIPSLLQRCLQRQQPRFATPKHVPHVAGNFNNNACR